MKETIVECTLAYGRNMKRGKFLALFFVVIGICLTSIAFTLIETLNGDSDATIGTVVGVLILIPSIGIAVEEKKVKRLINLWLEDAVELEAFCALSNDYVRHINGAVKISVTFRFGQDEISQVSGMQGLKYPASKQDGYDSWFKKYVDKKIKILYSPKYNQVMIPYQ